MAVSLIPYGKLADGKYGILLQNGTTIPLAAVMEIMPLLPSVLDTGNFDGRLVFNLNEAKPYVFSTVPSGHWIPLLGVPAEVTAVNGNPPTVPTPVAGSLLYDTDTDVLYLFDGAIWQLVGGRFAAQYVTQRYTGDGITTVFAIGTTQILTVNEVEVYEDGVRQYPNPSGRYNVIGTNVVFGSAPAVGVLVYIRATVSQAIAANSQAYNLSFKEGSVAPPNPTTYDTNLYGLDPSTVFVYRNGRLQSSDGQAKGFDIRKQNTTILTLNRVGATATIVTQVAHGYTSGSVGSGFEIVGTDQPQYNSSFIISAVPTATQIQFTVPLSYPTSAVGAPTMSFWPPTQTDKIVIPPASAGVTTDPVDPVGGAERIDIRILKNTVTAPVTGEINTGSNLGSGAQVFANKVAQDLRFRTLKAGNGISLSTSSTEITISATQASSYEERIGTNVFSYSVTGPESYVGVRNTTNPVTINLNLAQIPGNDGRRLIIQDESGGAGTNNITIIPVLGTINGSGGAKVIQSNYGSITMIFDGANWFIVNTQGTVV